MEHGEIKEAGGGLMSSSTSNRKGSSSNHEVLKCPRCDSLNTKFCYYNNYNLSQPRHFCKNCRRYWTKGGSLRSVPVGGGCRKNKRSRHSNNAIRSNSSSSSVILDGHLSSINSSSAATTNAFLHSVQPHLMLHDFASSNHNNFGLTFSRLQESMRSSPSSLIMPHNYEPLNINPHLNLDQTSLVNHLGIYNNNNNNPPPATDLSLLIDDHHRPFTASTASTAPVAAGSLKRAGMLLHDMDHAEWSKLHHHHKLAAGSCMQLMMNDDDQQQQQEHGHHQNGFGHIIPPPGFPEEEKPLLSQSNTMDQQQQQQWLQGGMQQMESGILQEGWAWPDFFSLAGSAAGTIP